MELGDHGGAPAPPETSAPLQRSTRMTQTQPQSRWGEPLPDVVVQFVFIDGLPADARARCGSVCRAWAHALLRGPDAWRCWTELDLSRGGGVTCRVHDAELAGAAALARGRLQSLDLSDRRFYLSLDAVQRVMRGNAQHLQRLALGGHNGLPGLTVSSLRGLLGDAGPALQTVAVQSTWCSLGDGKEDLFPLLRAEPPFGRVRVGRLKVNGWEGLENLVRNGGINDLRPLAAAVATASLRELSLVEMRVADLAPLADALLAPTCRVESLTLQDARITDLIRCRPALARVLAGGGGALTEVHVEKSSALFVAASATQVEIVCAALRRSTLTRVRLQDVGLSPRNRAALLEAAAAAPQLRQVDIT